MVKISFWNIYSIRRPTTRYNLLSIIFQMQATWSKIFTRCISKMFTIIMFRIASDNNFQNVGDYSSFEMPPIHTVRRLRTNFPEEKWVVTKKIARVALGLVQYCLPRWRIALSTGLVLDAPAVNWLFLLNVGLLYLFKWQPSPFFWFLIVFLWFCVVLWFCSIFVWF